MERREEIVAAAVRVLARDGVPSATTRSIAAEAKINLATVHYYFGGKDALLAEVLDTLSNEVAEIVRGAIPTSGGVREALEHGLTAVWQLAQQTTGLQIAQYELTTAALRAGEPERARQQYAAYHRVITALVEETLAASGEHIAVPVDALVAFLVAGMDGLILNALVAPADESEKALQLFIAAAVALADPQPARDRKSA
jgi:AcrR family transcriptional regulator